MKLATIVFAAATAVAAVSAQTATTPAPAPTTAAPEGNAKVSPPAETTAPAAATPATASSGNGTSASSGTSALSKLKATPTTDSYHMAPVRVVHARVQSDSPALVEGQLVSSFGKGKLDAGYLSAMDSVNTASVEGALMYVQAETINVDKRDSSERCVRKTKVAQVVFYEILIAQTNETIAQFQADWATPEYGPFIAMDGGKCSETSPGVLPPGCYQFNGEQDQPNVGPFVGGENRELSDRAPYPGNYWFSFPNTCPTQAWANKTEACRASTRKGLCPVGVAPNGVECTFAYNILGWVPIDDVVGITEIVNNDTQKPYKNFTEWCSASPDHIEFSWTSGKEKTSLPFWSDPLNTTANEARTQKMLETYANVLKKGSGQIDSKVLSAFKPLPTPEELAKSNPPCYKSVASCGTGAGCKRTGYSQLCTPCKAEEKCPTGDGTFKFPTLKKAFTKLPDSATKTNGTTGGSSSASKSNGTSTDGSKTGSAAHATVAFATVAASVLLSLAL